MRHHIIARDQSLNMFMATAVVLGLAYGQFIAAPQAFNGQTYEVPTGTSVQVFNGDAPTTLIPPALAPTASDDKSKAEYTQSAPTSAAFTGGLSTAYNHVTPVSSDIVYEDPDGIVFVPAETSSIVPGSAKSSLFTRDSGVEFLTFTDLETSTTTVLVTLTKTTTVSV